MRKDVLVLEYQEVFDVVACRIVYQDDEILKRGEFMDENIGVFSASYPQIGRDVLCIRGTCRESDNRVFVVSKKEAEIIKDKVKAINEKYGRKERWRAETGEEYWTIVTLFGGCYTAYLEYDFRDGADNESYEAGNYFKTYEQAEEASKRVLATLKQYQEELLKEK